MRLTSLRANVSVRPHRLRVIVCGGWLAMADNALIAIEPCAESGRIRDGLKERILSGRSSWRDVGTTLAGSFQFRDPKLTLVEHRKLIDGEAGYGISRSRRTAADTRVLLGKADWQQRECAKYGYSKRPLGYVHSFGYLHLFFLF